MQASRVIVLGSINTDLVVKTPRLPRPGETVVGGEFYRAAGGKGANQAVAVARNSLAPVLFVAAVGNDAFGRESREQLQRENLDCTYLKTVAEQPSGVALIMVDEQGENVISVASGANDALTPDDVARIDDAAFAAARIFVTSLETPLETVAAGLRRARASGMTTILNPAPARREIVSGGILELVDILTPNENEAAYLAETDDGTSALQAARKLQLRGAGTVIATCGAAGCLVVMGDGAELVPAHRVSAIDATAAGDTFNGALVAALSDGLPLIAAVRRANAAAALSVTRRGAQPSIPTREEVDFFLASAANE